MSKVPVEYIWIDGIDEKRPTRSRTLRSKTKVVKMQTPYRELPSTGEISYRVENDQPIPLTDFPIWSFDGSSTYQAEGTDSDCILVPVRWFKDPFNAEGLLAICEVYNPDRVTPHPSNTRAVLRNALKAGAKSFDPLFGIEQEYVFMKGNKVLGWPEDGFPPPQGENYCGVGADRVVGRHIMEEHMRACIRSGIAYEGKNIEVLLGQGEYQVGACDPLMTADHLWAARWILNRIAEENGLWINLHPKPVLGNWNGSGQHTNFSTAAMRDKNGIDAIMTACEKMAGRVEEHFAVYGFDNHLRLVGELETSSMDKFTYGVADRGCSIRIPRHVALDGRGYLEDRRVASNADPYEVCTVMLKTCCDLW